MKKTVKWGILGCAGIARKAMIPAILAADDAQLYAIASRGEEKLQEFSALFHPEKTYLGYDALLDDPNVDAVYIPLPNSLHCEWVVRACEKGKPVLCEKPLAMNAAEAERIMAASARYNVPVMEAFAYLHGPLMGKLREILASGTLGKVLYIESGFSFLLRDLSNVRLVKEIGGGAAYDLGCYPVSFARAVTGEEPDELHAFTSVGARSRVDEDVLAMLHFPSGVKASMYFSFQSHWRVSNTVLCEYGRIEVPTLFYRGEQKILTISTEDERSGEGERKEIVVDQPSHFVCQIEQMNRVVRDGQAPAVSLDFSLGNARVLDKILKL